MFLPPMIIDVHLREEGSRGFRLWLPFFLLWPLVLPVFLLALLVSSIADLALIVAGARYHHYTALLLGTVRLLAEMRGTHAHIVDSDSFVHVDII